MVDLWLEIILTTLVTVTTVLTNWIAYLLISSTRRLYTITRIVKEKLDSKDKVARIQKELEKYSSVQTYNIIWGSELTAVAFSMDIAILGLWMSHPEFFPFFSRWDSIGVSREIPVWFAVLFSHFILLLASIIFKHFHEDLLQSIDTLNLSIGKRWFIQNRFMLISNMLGYFTLLSCFAIILNAI